ncbi:hypothetical protein MN116_000047 [Schistosoma mekongi]|uniref:DUF7083 domain-containing protein n=1 Tax=Schistosoma mekongi TaxID=38744 RepID=A0AAE1ZAY5_SCHME|nr:hypothetical protein MN116_000047 [Schistosoma mekongi]
MNITFEQLEAYMERQEKRFEQSQIRIMETLMQKMLLNQQSPTSSERQVSFNESVISAIHEFHFDGVAGVTFDSWFKKYEDLFRIDLCRMDDASKVRILLRKLGTIEHERYSNFILPKNPRDFSFDETVQTLSQIFGEQSSLFNIRYQCLKIMKNPGDDWVKHAGIVNRECERFKLSSMTEDQFKCLIFVCSLHSPEDADIRTRILSKLEHCPSMTLQEVTTECQRLVNLKHDTSLIENGSRFLHVNALERTDLQGSRAQNYRNGSGKPPSPCWLCGDWHFKRFCPFKNHRCTTCLRKGHKESRCRTRKRRQPKVYSRRFKPRTAKVTVAINRTASHSRRKYVSVKINGYGARLQLDTASDITLISRRTWDRIGRPRIYPTQQTARSASGGMLNIAGEIYCPVTVRGVTQEGVIFVTERPSLDLLGLDWLEKLKLMDRPISMICNNVSTMRIEEKSIGEKQAALETSAQIISEVEQPLDDKRAAASEVFTKSHSAYPTKRAQSIAANPVQKVISRTVSRLPVSPMKLYHSAQRCIKNKKIATVVNARSRHGQVLDFPTHPRSCNNAALKTMHLQRNEVLFLPLHKEPTTFRGGGA